MLKIKALLYFIFISAVVNAQVTTSEIRGQVNISDSEALPGAIITAIHLPTGTKYYCSSFSDGSYVLPNLKTGGPYEISVSFIGYLPQTKSDIYLSLGESKSLVFTMKENTTELSEVEVTTKQNDPFDSKRRGTGTTVGKDNIETLPTLNRSLSDVSKLTPQSSGNSFGGSNYRFNNLNIDGAGSNDAFGFQEPTGGSGGSTASGTPGSLAKTQPISLDAIDQLQINIAPYDVKIGNFTGASINAVTRSGTNKTDGSVYFFERSQNTTGKSVDASRSKLANYNDFQSGFRIGGPILKDKLFYFVNYEFTNRSESVQFAPGSNGSSFSYQEMNALKDTLLKRYNYDAGSIDDVVLKTSNQKLFTRIDWNINNKNQFLIRLNVVDGITNNLERAPTILNFGGQGFSHQSTNLNVVAELKTRISNNLSNNLIVGLGKVHDKRDPVGDEIFPHIEITYNTSNIIFLGTYREAAVFQMKQRNYEITDNLVYYKNKHTFTLGTHTEIFDFNYHFVTPYSGRWAYKSLDDFYANKPSRIRGTYNLGDASYDNNYNNPSANFKVILPSLYAQHDVKVNSKFRFTYGLRLEGNLFPYKPNLVPDFQSTKEFSDVQSGIKNQINLSPRFGFNYDLTGKGKFKVRGGSGIFVGRMPFAWMAYAYIYNGNQFGNIDYKPTTSVNLVTNDYSQLGSLQPGLKEINIVDKDFKLPKVWRSNLAFDIKLPKDIILTIEGLYTKTIYDVLFKTINAKDSTVALQGGDGRPIYAGNGSSGKYNPNYTNVFMLTNTTNGFRYNLSVSLAKEFKFGLNIFTAYSYGVSKDIMNGVRVSPQANWEWNQTINANDPQLSYSNFDIRHRTITNISYAKNWKRIVKKSMLSFVFNSQSGSPFTYIYSGDLNRDGSPNNDLFYVPSSQSEINLVDIKDASGNVLVSANDQWTQLETYINNDKYLASRKGKNTERNGGRTPWNMQLDMRLSNEFKLGKKTKQTLQVLIDVINFTNLLNRNWGHQTFVPNTTNAGYSLVSVKSVSSTGVATYQFNNPSSKPWQIDPIASRWQMQLGLRFNF